MDETADVIDSLSPTSPAIIQNHHSHSKSRARISSFQDSLPLSTLPFILMLLIPAVIFGIAVLNLGMLTLDYQGLLAATNGTFFTYLSQITSSQGLTHPLGILFNTAMYTLALQMPAIAHLVPYIAHVLTGMLLAIMVSRKYTRLESALFGLLFITLPFFTGQYGWLAQGNLSIALFVLTLQLLFVQSTRLDIVVKSAFLVFLQIIAILLHESLLFSFIPILIFLLPMEKPCFGGVHLRTLVLLSIPSLIYLFLKLFVLPPHTDFFQTHIIDGFSSFFNTVSSMLTYPLTYVDVWRQAFNEGLLRMGHTDITILLVGAFTGLLVYELALFFTHRSADGAVSSPLVNPLFWALMGICTSVPYNPSALGFPLFCFFVALLQLIRLFSRRVGVIVACTILILALPISLGLLGQMRHQAMADEKHIDTIISLVTRMTKTEKVGVVVENPPVSTALLPFHQYLQPCISLPECLQPALARKSDRITAAFVGQAPPETTVPLIFFTYQIDTEEVIQK